MSSTSAWLLAAVLSLPGFAYAQTLRFEEVAQRTLAHRAEFKRFAISAEQGIEQRTQAQRKPALELQATLENVLGTGSVSGVKGAELSVAVGSSFEPTIKRTARVALVDARAELLSVEQKIAALDVLADAARRFVALARAQSLVKISADLQAQAATSLDQAKQRFAAAATPKTDVLNAEILLSEATLLAAKSVRARQVAQRELAQLWGATEVENLHASLDLFVLPTLASEQDLQQQLMRTPDLARFASAVRVQDAELALAKAQARPDWQWSVGIRRLQASSDQALIGSFSVPLGSTKRAQSTLRSVELERRQLELDQAIETARIESSLRRLLQQLADAKDAEQEIRARQLPQAQEVYQLIQQGLRLGRYSTRDLAYAHAQWLRLQLDQLEAASAFHLTRVEIERVTGASLTLMDAIQ